MSIGIIGSGALGSNVARMFAKRGISATIANRRGVASLAPLIAEVGSSIKAGTIEEAAGSDIVLVAVRWVDLEKALGGLPAWNRRIVVDATNAVEFLEPNSPDRKDPTNPSRRTGSRRSISEASTRAKSSASSFPAHASSRRSTTSTFAFCRSRRCQEAAACSSIPETMTQRRPRSERSWRWRASFRSTSGRST
jgi:hypothetical protein